MVGRSEEPLIQGVEFLKAEFGPCIICGHPTGDCTAEDHTIVFEEDIEEDTIVVEEDIIERRWITPEHLAKVLVVPAGKRISRSEAQKLGLI
tara:strand:- start:9294 stop:9569 length:276 start_codon:yes stop_codon:yes gene_type:complete